MKFYLHEFFDHLAASSLVRVINKAWFPLRFIIFLFYSLKSEEQFVVILLELLNMCQ